MRFRLLAELWRLSDERELDLIAAGIAFYGFLAIFPSIAALIALWGMFADIHVIRQDLELLRAYLPADAFSLLSGQIESLLALHSNNLQLATLLSLGVALWSARAGVAAFMRGLNAIHDLPNRWGYHHHIRAMILTLTLIGMVIVAMFLSVVGPTALRFVPLGGFASVALDGVQITLSLLLVVGGVAVLYRLGLNRRDHPLFTRGILVAVVIWIAASRGFVIYLRHFDAYNRIYGSIGAVVVLMMWLYFSAYAILLGAAVDAARAKRRAGVIAPPNPDLGPTTPR